MCIFLEGCSNLLALEQEAIKKEMLLSRHVALLTPSIWLKGLQQLLKMEEKVQIYEIFLRLMKPNPNTAFSAT